MMNGREQPRRISKCFKDKDEELSFFRDLQKREKDQVNSLLQPVSDEFEPYGTYGMYKMDSGGRKGTGIGFLAESGKNDYNWLKTPPATPLFPSLEMETKGQELVIQREIPIIQPLSRFAGNQESTKTKTVINRSTTPNPKPKLPQRHKTPNGRPSISYSGDKKNTKAAPIMITQKASSLPSESRKAPTQPTAKNLSKPEASTFLRPKSSVEMPHNLRMTNRPTSTTRGRPTNQNLSTPQKQEMNTKIIRRQSCSPSVTRGRKVDLESTVSKTGGNRTQILGSRMVDRFISARTSSVEERQGKIKLNGSMNENPRMSEERQPKIKLNGSLNDGSGFGRLMSKSSLDMAIKHMEFQRDSSNTRKHGMVPARKS